MSDLAALVEGRAAIDGQAGETVSQASSRATALEGTDMVPGTLIVPTFGLTALVGAGLLFIVQPLFAKTVLPVLGGAPAVWNVCTLLFQISLLGGYAYAHGASRWLTLRQQVAAQFALLLVAAVSLPFSMATGTTAATGHPIAWLITTYVTSVAVPFMAVSTTAPMVQTWLQRTAHRSAGDPYFLYAASNTGSLLGLLAYPVVVEPLFDVNEQGRLWGLGFGLLALLVLACGLLALMRSQRTLALPSDLTQSRAATPTLSARLEWMALAAIPASHMLAVTTYLTTDVASVPLLWVIPLSLYLGTFILAFATREVIPHKWMVRATPLAVACLLPLLVLPGVRPHGAVHLLVFAIVSLMCHGTLARRRPVPAHLTGFYLSIAAGGVIGGMFNTLVAPFLFTRVTEYPLVLVAACALTPALTRRRSEQLTPYDAIVPLAIAIASAVLVLLERVIGIGEIALVIGFVWLSVFSLAFSSHRLRFALAMLALMTTGSAVVGHSGTRLHEERTFFGVYRVTVDHEDGLRFFRHGTTLHGAQAVDPGRSHEPLTYYHRRGPVGDVFDAVFKELPQARVGVIGLGAGTMAAYARAGDEWTFYEIDPAVQRIASNPAYFTYLSDCGARCRTVLGDARLTLASTPAGQLDLLVLDAFSSDSIPIHLLTREAIQMYLDKIQPDGLIALHISNRFLALEGIVARLARDLSLDGVARFDMEGESIGGPKGKQPSHWVVLSKAGNPQLLAVADHGGWDRLEAPPSAPLWTDAFSNIISVVRWK